MRHSETRRSSLRAAVAKSAGVLFASLGALAPVAAQADSTITQTISRLLYNGSADYTFVVGPSGWGASGCNAYYVQITSAVPGRDKLLAIILAAHVAGRRVQFQGACNPDPTYFDATYVIVSD